MPRRRSRLVGRASLVTILAMLLVVVVPPGSVPQGASFGSLSWLRSLLTAGLTAAPGWADPGVPGQGRGSGVKGHYVDAPKVRADGKPSGARAAGELDWYQPYQPQVAGRSTGSARKGYDARTSSRVPALSSARADVYQNADGSYTRKVYWRPTNYQTPNGSWQPIDTTLRAGSDQRPKVAANSFDVSFAGGTPQLTDRQVPNGSAADGARTTPEDLVRVGVRPGVQVAYSLAGADVERPTLQGAVARYDDVFPNVNLELAADATGMKETLLLRSAQVPTEYVYPLRLTGLTARIGGTGAVEFVDAAGAVAVSMPPGYMEDATVDDSGAGVVSHGVRYDLVTVDGGPAVKMTIDGAWLRDPKRKYPVVLDPQTTVGTVGDTFAYSSAAGTSQSSLDNVAVGSYDGGTNRARAFLNFDNFPTAVAGRKLDSVRLQLFMSYQGNGDGTCVARAYNVYPITSSWTVEGATWNNMPAYDTGRLLGSDSPSSSAACGNSAKDRTVGVWSSPWLNVGVMQQWAAGGSGIRGLAVVADEGDKYAWKRFTSANPNLICPHWYFGNVQCDPFMEVNYYDNVGPQVDARYPANNTAVSTLTPEFAAKGSDPDNWPNTGLNYNYTIYNDQGTQIANSGWVDGAWTPPVGTLAWGKTYLYTAQAGDRMTGGATSVPYAFTTQVPQPMVTSSLAQNGGKGFEASVGNYTTSEIDAQVATAGPALSVSREYNSLDTRATSAFGLGWSTLADMRVVENQDAAGVLQTATIRYPNGQEVTFGRNNDGTWTPPSGRYSVFKAITGGYALTDKDATIHEFAKAIGGGAYALTRIVDAAGRAVSLRSDAAGHVDQVRSDASGRTLTLAWTTPAGASNPHVSTVSTDPTDPADPASALTWTYSYDGDRLTKVCPPGTTTDCARYDYQPVAEHATTVLNTGPYSFWRLNEASGQTQAKSGVLSNDGVDTGVYNNVTLGVDGPLTNSTSTATTFNGTSSSVKLPVKLATESSYQSISLWFRTDTPLGVLFGYQKSEVTAGATTTGDYNPVLYVGNDGKLRGQLQMDRPELAITTADPVTDNRWHHVALSGNGGSQDLYLDGQRVGTLAGALTLHNADLANAYLGAGYLGGAWPAQPATTGTTGTATYFKGQLADVAYYTKPLTATDVTALFGSATPSTLMTKVTSNAGRVRAEVGYDTVTGRVSQVTDEHGGVWKVGAPTVSGSSQVYASTVLGSKPREYLRLGDIDAPTAPKDLAGGIAGRYSNVTFDTTQTGTSPFTDAYGAIFNGSNSYVRFAENDGTSSTVPQWGSNTVELWFRVPAGTSTSGVLYAYQYADVDAADTTVGNWTPALYVGADGLLRGGFWTGSVVPITSTTKVNDGAWHHVVLSGSYQQSRQTLYLDNTVVGTAGRMEGTDAVTAYLGAGTTRYWPGSSSDVSYFKGNIVEYAHYERALSQTEVDAHYKASRSALPVQAGVTGPVLTPVTTVSVTDPGGKTSSRTFDLLNGNRLIADTDPLGNTTSYGYDVGGFESVVYDPLGHRTETGRDVRGNTVRSTTCLDQIGTWIYACQTTLYEYWPDATSVTLAPDPRNDQLIKVTEQAEEHSVVTTFSYDERGNRTAVTSPPVPGFPNGRTVTTTFTTATTPAIGGGVTPTGLPMTTTSAGGAKQTTEYNAFGDTVRITDATGLVTEFSYDGLGRSVTKKVVSTAYPAGQVTTYGYDPDGTLATTTEPAVTNRVTGAVHTLRTTDVTDADGNVLTRTQTDLTGGDSPRRSTNVYNDHGEVIKTVDPAGVITLYGYDAYGRVNRAVVCDSDPNPGDACPGGDVLHRVDQVFDAEGQLLTSTETGPDGTGTQTVSNAYYADGTMAAQTDAMGWTTRFEYWHNQKVKKITRTDGTTTTVLEENRYDGAGNLMQQVTNNGATWTLFDTDDANRLSTKRVVTSFAGAGRFTNYVYDADDRVVTERRTVFQNGTPDAVLDTVENSYDAMGRLTSRSVSADRVGGPAGWWQFNGTTNPGEHFEVVDSSGSGHLLQGLGNMNLSNDTAVFQGDFLGTIPVLDTTQSYSVSAWVKPTALTGFQTAVGQGGTAHAAFLLQYNGYLGKWALVSPSSDSANPSTAYYASSSTALTANTWVHLVGVFDANTKAMSIYVNNTKGTDGSNPTPWQATNGFGVGGVSRGSSGVDTFTGSIDNVQVYQRALDASDVAKLWDNGNGRTATATATTNRLTTSYTVDNRGLTTSVTDPNGNVTNLEYDEAGQLTTTIEPGVNVEAYSGTAAASLRPMSLTGYNTFGEVVEEQDPLGNLVRTKVDALGRPWQTTLPTYTPPGGDPIADASTTTVYDKLGNVRSVTDPLGRTTSFEYDTLGNRTKITDQAGKVSTAVYDKVGDLLETVDPTGAKTTATYDYLGRVLTSTQVVRQPTPSANTTTYDYGTGAYGAVPEAGPWLRKVTTPDGVTTSTSYNLLGEPVTVTDGAGNTTTTDYDGVGRPWRVIRPDGSKQVQTFDGAGRVVRTQELGAADTVLATQSAVYDGNGNVVSSTDARGTTTTFTYNARGLVTGENQPITATASINTSFGYDAAGHQTRFTSGRGHAFWTTYNPWGLPESQIEPATTAYPNAEDRTFTVGYDAAGRPAWQTQPGGVRVTSRYDERGRLVEQAGTGAEASTATRTFGYDDAGRITSLAVPDNTIAVDYDDRGLPLSVTGPHDNATYTYTKDGRPATRADAAGTTTFDYDTAGRIKTVANATTGINLEVAYNALSQPSTVTYGRSNVRTFAYDPLHRVKSDTIKTADGTATLGSITYDYDLNGNETSKVTTGVAGASTNTYGYDLADRLTSWTTGSTTTAYAYDASGNRTQAGSKTFRYDERNQLLTQSGGTTYAYTARGTLKSTSASAGTLITTTDAFGQVVAQAAVAGTSNYDYDALGRAIRTGFSYSGLGNTLASDGSAVYTRGAGGELLGTGTGSTGSGSVYAWTDQHTDVVGQFSANGRILLGSASYDPLGKVLAGSGLLGNLGYQSEWTDTTTGRVNMLARWYNTDTGQFDTRDTVANNPVSDSINANRFQYGDGNPMTTTDPTGHWGLKDLRKNFKAATTIVTKAVSSATTYVTSGQAWSDIKSTASAVVDKGAKAFNVVKNTTTRWVKQKANAVKDAYTSAKKCVAKGASKCVKETAKAVAKKTVETVKSTYESIKEDPWKFVATAATGIAAAAAVGALCATGIGCVILAGAVAGAMAAGAGYMTDVAQGDQKFSWSGLASTMIEGGLDGALSAGVSRFTGGVARAVGRGGARAVGAGGAARAASSAGPSRLPGSGARSSGGSSPARASGSGSSGSGGRHAASGDGYSGRHRDAGDGEYEGRHRGCHSFDPATLVLLADGSTKPIEDVQVGDQVVATDPQAGTSDAKPVTALHVNLDRDLTDVTVVNTGTGERSVLKTTAHHPFWDATTGAWVDAAALVVGHQLLVAHDAKRLEGDNSGAGSGGGGPPVEGAARAEGAAPVGPVGPSAGARVIVVAVANHTGAKVMRDLTVADIHTYYVIAGNEPVLVHNNNGGGSCPQSTSPRFAVDSAGEAVDLRNPPGSQADLNQRVGTAFRNDLAAKLKEWGYDVVTEEDNARALSFKVPGFAGKRRFDIGVWDQNGNHVAFIEAKWGKKRYGAGTEQAAKDQVLLKVHPWMRIQVIQSHDANGNLDTELLELLRR